MQDPLPGRGHNRPPAPTRRKPLSLDDEPVRVMIKQLCKLRGCAIGECSSHLRHRTDKLGVTRFFPSYLARWPTGRAFLVREFLDVWPAAISSRLGQLQHLNRKLARCCPAWRPLSLAELVEPPAFTGHEPYVRESIPYCSMGSRLTWR